MATKKRDDQTGDEKIAELKIAAIAAAEVVYHYKIVANSIGYSEDGLKVWRNNDKDFSDKLEQARSRFLQRKIKIAKPEFLLERLEPDIFKQKQSVDVTSADRPLTILHLVPPEVKDDTDI